MTRIPFECPTCGTKAGAGLLEDLRDRPTEVVLFCVACERNFGVSLIDLAAMERAGECGLEWPESI